MSTGKQAAAEFFGTFWLVFGGTGAAVLAASLGATGNGLVGVALAFGLTVVTMAYAVGHISGGHFNPAVTIGLWVGGRFPAGKIVVYIAAQVLGASAASAVFYVIASGKAGFTLSYGFAANGYGDHSPAGYTMLAAIVIELVLTFFFLLVIHGVTDRRAPAGRPGAAGQRPGAHPHPSHQHPGGQHVGEPRAQSVARPLRGRLGAQPAVALHRVPDRGRGDRRSCVPVPA
jgi:aquaporin Z